MFFGNWNCHIYIPLLHFTINIHYSPINHDVGNRYRQPLKQLLRLTRRHTAH